jgi:photosystem II stability/assembly factor-like uncharacterized protein
MTAGTQSIVGKTFTRAAGSADGGKTWVSVVPPAVTSGVAIDPANPQRGIAGGSSIQVTTNGGSTWKPVQVPPPPTGPYEPVLISPFDGNVWFFVHGGKLLRTRDGAQTWRDIPVPGLTTLSFPQLVAGQVFGQFYLASGGSVFSLIDNGQDVVAQPSLPAGESVTDLAAPGGNGSTLFARGSTGAAYLLKGGTWLPVTGAPRGPIAAGANGILVVGDGGGKLGSPGVVASSADGGSTWRQASGLPYDQSVEALAGQPTTVTFVAYCYGGDVYISANGGRDWTLLSRALRTTSG